MNTRVALCCLAAMTLAACERPKSSPTTPTPPAVNVVNYTAVGASDAIGIGSSALCIPFVPCPNGRGYVQIIERRLTADGKTLTHLNLALPGGVLSPEIEQIGDGLGRNVVGSFLERLAPFVARESTLVTVFAGGNDVNIVGAALEAGLGGSDPSAYVAARTQNFGRDLRALVNAIRDRASQARIVVLNLPNMAAMPYAGGYSLTQKRVLQQIAVGFSAEINALASMGVLVVDLMCDASMYQASIYSADGFHPSDNGYQRMADLVYPPASTGAASAPRASCAQMTLF